MNVGRNHMTRLVDELLLLHHRDDYRRQRKEFKSDWPSREDYFFSFLDEKRKKKNDFSRLTVLI